MDQPLQHIAEQIRAAAADGEALRLRGSGSKDFYGQSLQGRLLDTSALRGIVSYEPSELVVTVRAGTPLAELEALLATRGQYMAWEPPCFGPGATVGGMLAAGLSGPARASAGGVRDFVLGVQLLDAQAQLLRFGGQVMKNVAGYDVSRLMVGALGTLGLLVETSLKVLPRPVAEATLAFEADPVDALRRVRGWGSLPLPINASAWFPDPGPGRLLLRLRGAAAAVQEARASLGGVEEGFDWEGLREQRLAAFTAGPAEALWRLSLPDTTSVLALPAGARLAAWEWGGALRWVLAPPALALPLRALAAAAGGHATLFRRPAQAMALPAPVFHPLSAPLERIHRSLKQRFDPQGLFNRGRLYDAF